MPNLARSGPNLVNIQVRQAHAYIIALRLHHLLMVNVYLRGLYLLIEIAGIVYRT